MHGKTVVQPLPSQIVFDLHFDREMNVYMSEAPGLGRVMTEKRFVPGKYIEEWHFRDVFLSTNSKPIGFAWLLTAHANAESIPIRGQAKNESKGSQLGQPWQP